MRRNVTCQRAWLFIIVWGQVIYLYGCSLVPKEEEPRSVSIVREEKTGEYSLAMVKKETVTLTKKFYCTYSQLSDENLSFGIDGKQVAYVYVKEGDIVKKGDKLAQLDIDNVEDQIKETGYSIEKASLLLNQVYEKVDLELEQKKKLFNSSQITQVEYEKSVEDIQDSYKDSINGYEDSLYIDNLKLEALMKEREESMIHAGMDGTVSYVRSQLLGSSSVKDETVIKVIDSSECAFRLEDPEGGTYFSEGDKVTIINSSNSEITYETTVLPKGEDSNIVNFQLDNLEFELSVGSRGVIIIVLDEKNNVLALPKLAVHKADQYYYVYYMDLNGIRSIKEIEIGLIGDNLMEITDGLTVDDVVVKQ